MRRTLPLCLVAGLVLAFAATPAMARAGHASAKSHPAVKGPSNKQLKKSIAKANNSIKSLATALAALTGESKTNAATIQTIVDGVPAIVNGLTALKDGLTTLATAYTSVEYGVLHGVVNVNGSNAADTPNQFSPDIPDDGNGAQVSGELPVPIATNLAPGGFGLPVVINVRASIRSGEADGKATGDPAGEVGGAYFVTCATAGGCGPTVPSGSQSDVPTGSIMCSALTPTNNYSYTNPSSGTTSLLQLVPIQQGTSRTDQSRPSDDPTDAMTVDAAAGNKCSFTASNDATYILHSTFQFFDLPTSTSPGPAD